MGKVTTAMMAIAIAATMAGCGSSSAVSAATSSPKVSSGVSGTHIRVGTALVNGKKTQVLQTANGFTMYYYTLDTPTHSACNDQHSCAEMWPRVYAYKVPSVAGAPGTFSLVHGQLEYQGHLLYTYMGDEEKGQAMGEGVTNDWWVATPSLKLWRSH